MYLLTIVTTALRMDFYSQIFISPSPYIPEQLRLIQVTCSLRGGITT